MEDAVGNRESDVLKAEALTLAVSI